MKKIINPIILLLLLFGNSIKSQNLLNNADFEDYITCPTELGQADNATNWFNSIVTSDYYNCDFVSSSEVPTTSLAYSGTGFIGFLSYGDANGSAEAIGQNLSFPLLPNPNNTYSVQFAAKRPYQGLYANNCGGVEIYGFIEAPPDGNSFIHASQHPEAILLGASPIIQDTSWQMHTVNLNIEDTINSVVFTISLSQFCLQYIFLDSLSLTKNTVLTTPYITNLNQKIKLYPNPASREITIEIESRNLNQGFDIEIFDFFGKIVLKRKTQQGILNLNIENLAKGVYVCRIIRDKTSDIQKFIVGK